MRAYYYRLFIKAFKILNWLWENTMKKICVALLMLGNVCAVSALAANASAHNLLTPAMNQFLLADNDQDQNADASNNQPADQDDNTSNADQNNDQNDQKDQSDDQMDNDSDND
ncbi:hypothetical protein CbuD7D7780_06070 [Coxiella burnetii]|uniref:Hypothetical exported protein n=1 Tax=Coxiella burnetii (strain Dugway 5J108-111) TaxID=434922 RepID=A9KE29_COXBN|nr:hypothetical protein [Coxiella burnetii]ABS77115.2 hypothetical exported protein [Coxiella burnetii Dugway 5J108-111]OYK80318.1 hypothetical protein CbuD7E6568_06050 [Coxiella burnetii]OYK82400.1 hypothetical protein CbuD7D7780_06070 [Coxiella burnetii]